MIKTDEYNQQIEIVRIKNKIFKEVQEIKFNADSYGEVVEIVAKREKFVVSKDDPFSTRYEYEYKLSDGRIISNDYAWELANAGKLKGIIGSHNKGKKYIKSVGDSNRSNNLGTVPRML